MKNIVVGTLLVIFLAGCAIENTDVVPQGTLLSRKILAEQTVQWAFRQALPGDEPPVKFVFDLPAGGGQPTRVGTLLVVRVHSVDAFQSCKDYVLFVMGSRAREHGTMCKSDLLTDGKYVDLERWGEIHPKDAK